MAEYLVIVESPAKAKTIAKYLGRQYTVKASFGHLRDLPKSQLGVDVDHDFAPKYITIRGRGDLLKELKTAARKATKVYLATDPDREGEAISWHLAQALELDMTKPCRVTFNEITKSAVQKAFKEPRDIAALLVSAQQTRRILDRIVGYKLSPLLWAKVKKGLSAGRVQSVAVRIIVDRDEEIAAFIPTEYWSLMAELRPSEGKAFLAKLSARELPDEAAVKAVMSDLSLGTFVVESVKKSQRERKPAPPFTTSTLQQEASRKLGFTAKRTMRLAQALYEGIELGKEGAVGLITYMRTDSTRLSDTALASASQYITERFGKEYHESRQFAGKGGAQDAHEAVRPTYVERPPLALKDLLSRDHYKLYKLIFERFIASQMAPALYAQVHVEVAANKYLFKAHGSRMVFAGFTAVYSESQDEADADVESELPELVAGQRLALGKLTPKQHFTEAPPAFTEASLIKLLEEEGIGRPSTYAPIIDTIVERGYVTKDKKKFMATELGQVVVRLLKEYFPEIVEVAFTAKMEAELDSIEHGTATSQEILRDFYAPFAVKLAHAFGHMEKISVSDEESDQVCELCGRRMVIKMGRFGKFLACPGFPECKNTKPLLTETGAICPLCQGKVVQRRSKKGRLFYGCANYPTCEFVSWNKPLTNKCTKCGSFTVEKKNRKDETTIVCGNPACGFLQEEVHA
ncbi:MAG: type I DNA topoisomerase [Firmicutes bacterium]|nr:type I DNA topoisomerase [Dethiobacter sp.]MBS3888669.1 type I DNA topoisomerase [Bacillota bacterium]MBS4053307.1 type I DNA topoisomerase [Thermaerobacter sp.]